MRRRCKAVKPYTHGQLYSMPNVYCAALDFTLQRRLQLLKTQELASNRFTELLYTNFTVGCKGGGNFFLGLYSQNQGGSRLKRGRATSGETLAARPAAGASQARAKPRPGQARAGR